MKLRASNNLLISLGLSITLWLIIIAISLIRNDYTISIDGIVLLHSRFEYWIIDFVFIIINPSLLVFLYIKEESVSKQKEFELSKMSLSLGSNIEFTENLINENLDYDKSVENTDVLGLSLVQLRDRLKNSKLEEFQRKKEDEERRWATEGQAKFAELLRQTNNQDLSELSYSILSNLVLYLNANQGGFYLFELDEHDKKKSYFDLLACYAYERKRIQEKRIPWGNGLIGRCAIEQETIFLTDIPAGYVKITSGLGEETPRNLVIVPMISNDNLQGIIEIASFTVFEPFQIVFIEKIAEIIASTLAGVKINIQTAKLLDDSRAQGQKLAKQEETMRQNIEEMKMLQKEAAKQSEEFVSFSNSVNHTMIRADYNVNGTLVYANTKFLKKLGYETNSQVEGKSIFTFIHEKDTEWFKKIWSELAHGGKHYEGFMKHITKDDKDLWTLSTYTCVKDEHGLVSKVLFLAIDTTENKIQSLNFEGIISALDRSSLKAEFGIIGDVLDCNTNFLNSIDYGIEEVRRKTIFDLVDDSEKDNIKKIWNTVVKNVTHDGTIKYLTRNNAEKWLFGSYTTVKDMYGDVAKVVFVGNDTTEQVTITKKAELQNQKLQEQESIMQLHQVELEKKLEEARQEMKSQFSEIEKMKLLNDMTLEGALDAIFTIDQSRNIIFFNRAAELLWGYSKEEVSGKHISMLFSDNIQEEDGFVSKMVEKTRQMVISTRQEIKITDKAGEDKSVLILLSEAQYEESHTFTAFVQNIELELF